MSIFLLGATFQVRLSALTFFLKKKKELKQLLQSFAQASLLAKEIFKNPTEHHTTANQKKELYF